jgi:hypothetical protein
MAAAAMAKFTLLLVILVQFCGVLAAASRTLSGDNWLEDGVRMVVTQILGTSKSQGSGDTHCC